MRLTVEPHKADSILVIDANTVLALATTLQSLKPIFGGLTQIIQIPSIVQNLKLASRNDQD
jgi:hypothetical protein